MHKFKCPDGHEFEAKRSFYAHCPICGKNAKRIYESGEENAQTSTSSAGTNSDTERGTTTEESEEKQGSTESGETKNETTSTVKPKRIKVTREQKTEKETSTSSTGQSSSSSPAKKVKIKRGAAPQVKKKIVTTRDRKMNKEKKEERSTAWTRIKRYSLF